MSNHCGRHPARHGAIGLLLVAVRCGEIWARCIYNPQYVLRIQAPKREHCISPRSSENGNASEYEFYYGSLF